MNKLMTIDEYCGKMEGTFKKFVKMQDNDLEFSVEIEEYLRKLEEYREKTKNVSVGEY